MKQFDFSMRLSSEKLLEYYRGNVKNVVVSTDNGIRMQLPIEVLRFYVTMEGIYGAFIVYVDENNNFLRIEKKF